MGGKFTTHGSDVITWKNNLNSTSHLDIVEVKTPKPGNYFLPSVGMCEFTEALNSKRGIYIDR